MKSNLSFVNQETMCSSKIKCSNVTLFGKTRLNENCVEPFFHFNAFWIIRMHYRSFIMHFKTLTKFLNENENALKIILNSFSIICKHAQCISVTQYRNEKQPIGTQEPWKCQCNQHTMCTH